MGLTIQRATSTMSHVTYLNTVQKEKKKLYLLIIQGQTPQEMSLLHAGMRLPVGQLCTAGS